MYYFDGVYKTEILGIREIEEKNFNPMCWHLLDKDKANYVQVFIECIGGSAWITVHKNSLKGGST